jgi:hypothetical protein
MDLVLDLNRCGQVAHNLNMHKYFKLLSRFSGGLMAGWLTSTTAVFAQPKPSSPPTTAAPPAINYPSYSFFQGLTFSPFPGTIPRPVANGGINASPVFPLVEVPTPGLIAAKKPGTSPVVKRKKKLVTPEVEQPVRRRRRVIPKDR